MNFESQSSTSDEQTHDPEVLRALSREKTETEIALCILADKLTSELLKKYGLSERGFDRNSLFVVPSKSWEQDYDAIFSGESEEIFMKEEKWRLVFFKTLVHELIHLKTRGPVLPSGLRFTGISSWNGSSNTHTALNEALTEELTIETFKRSLSDPLLKKEAEETKALQTQLKGQDVGGRTVDDETYLLMKEPTGNKGEFRLTHMQHAYRDERRTLHDLAQKIGKVGVYTQAEAKSILITGYLSSNETRIRDMVDTSFGEGTWDTLGTLSTPELAQAVSKL